MWQNISIHALLAESDIGLSYFYIIKITISIHALLAESDKIPNQREINQKNFYPRSPCGERPNDTDNATGKQEFLSTLSLRRATGKFDLSLLMYPHFYPRSPCGERRLSKIVSSLLLKISIHALLAESDKYTTSKCPHNSNFYPRSPCGERRIKRATKDQIKTFLSTLSLRRATTILWLLIPPIIYFYPRSPCGERQLAARDGLTDTVFLSTLSLRRATPGDLFQCPGTGISIHALLAESDLAVPDLGKRDIRFLSTLSLRRATSIGPLIFNVQPHFYPRSPCGERHHRFRSWPIPRDNFYPRSPCGERHYNKSMLLHLHIFLSTLSLRRATPTTSRDNKNNVFLSTLSLRRAPRSRP